MCAAMNDSNMASSKKLKDVFEFVRRIKTSRSSSTAASSSTTRGFLTFVPTVKKIGYYGNCHYYTSGRKGLQLITGAGSSKGSGKLMGDDDGGGDGGGRKSGPPSPESIFRRWGSWILGFLATVVLPFWKSRWEQIQKIEGEAEVVVEEMDKVAKVVEKVAVVAEKVSEELAEALPENSKLQKTALVIENVSKVAATDAATAENIIQKVEVLKQDFEELEKAVHPVKHQ